MDMAERLVRIALLVRLIALGLAVIEMVVQGPEPAPALLLAALCVTSFAGLKSSRLRTLLSRHPLLAVPDLLLVSAVPPLVGDDSALSLVAVSSALVIGVLFTVRAAVPLLVLLVCTHLYALWPLVGIIEAARLPVTLASVAATGMAFRRLVERQTALEEQTAEARVSEAAARERLRVARDIHDTVAKACQGIALTASALPAWIDRDVDAASRYATEVSAAAREAVRSARSLMVSLRLDDPARPLAEVLTELVDRAAPLGDLTVQTDFTEVQPLTPGDRHELVWAVSEALDNVVRHARRSTVQVSLHDEGPDVVAVVSDDGPGFSPQRQLEALDAGHFGLVGIEERLAAVGGLVVIDSAPGAGTHMTLSVPAAWQGGARRDVAPLGGARPVGAA
jgi:signal transduction histidine kinase